VHPKHCLSLFICPRFYVTKTLPKTRKAAYLSSHNHNTGGARNKGSSSRKAVRQRWFTQIINYLIIFLQHLLLSEQLVSGQLASGQLASGQLASGQLAKKKQSSTDRYAYPKMQ
jgi:hypothetical protein